MSLPCNENLFQSVDVEGPSCDPSLGKICHTHDPLLPPINVAFISYTKSLDFHNYQIVLCILISDDHVCLFYPLFYIRIC